MRNVSAKLFAITMSALPLFAADSVTVDWNQVCYKAVGYRLTATTVTGDTVAGDCLGVTVTDLSVRTRGRKVVKIPRGELSKIQMHRRKGHLLRSLFAETVGGVLYGAAAFTYDPLISILWVPGALVWGAVRVPFYAVADLVHLDDGDTEILIR
jgi:hypothetical protein